LTTPNRNEIETRAKEMFNERNQHLPTITPTDSELKESGIWKLARNSLMRNTEKQQTLSYLEELAHSINYRVIPEAQFNGTTPQVHNGLLFDFNEAQKSNILISGTNSTGKSLLAMAICSALHKLGWRIIVFDNSGIWKDKSDIPLYHEITINQYYDLYRIPLITNESIIYDISNLTPETQKTFVDFVLRDLWNNRHNEHYVWVLIVLEEFELYARNIRGSTSQNLFRICHAGRNKQIRTLGITTDLALIDASFIRLCQQRYHARLGIEENSRRKYKNYYSKKWLQITEKLETGSFVYLNKNKLQLIKTPLFQRTTLKPRNINELNSKPSVENGLLAKIRKWF